MSNEIRKQASLAAQELVEAAGLKKGDILVVGCSSSEVCGEKIGTLSNYEIGGEVSGEFTTFSPKKGFSSWHNAVSILTEASL